MRDCISIRELLQPTTVRVCLLVLIAATLSVEFAAAQLVQTWDIKTREKSRALNSAAVTRLSEGATEVAISLLNQAMSIDPADPIPLNTLGIALAKQGKLDDSLEALRKAYKLDPSNPETLLTTGLVYYLQHDYDGALNAWSKVAELNPKESSLRSLLGFAHLRQGDLDAATECFRETIAARPNLHVAYEGLALVDYYRGDLSSARKVAEHCQSIKAYQPVTALLAKLAYLEGDSASLSRRLGEWRRLSAPKRQVSRSMTQLGYSLQHDFHWDPLQEDLLETHKAFQSRCERFPDGESRRKSRARAAGVDSLVSAARKKLERVPNDFVLWTELGVLQLGEGRYDEAADSFGKVLQNCPGCKVALLYLAIAQSRAGKRDEAIYAITEYRRAHPDQRLALELRGIVDDRSEAQESLRNDLQVPHSENQANRDTQIPSSRVPSKSED